MQILFLEMIVPPISGLIADKIGNFRLLIAIITFLNGAASLLLLTMGSFSTTDVYNNQSIELCCLENEEVCFDSNYLLDNKTNVDFNMTCSSQQGQIFNPTISRSLYDQTCLTLNCTLSQSNFENVTDQNMKMKLFWHYLSIRLVLDVLKSSSMSLFDGASIAIIKEYGGDFGLQKVFGAIGSIIFSPIAGK